MEDTGNGWRTVARRLEGLRTMGLMMDQVVELDRIIGSENTSVACDMHEGDS